MWLAISITVLIGVDSSGFPNVATVPHRLHETRKLCEEWRRGRYDNPWGVVDPVSGQPATAYYYECVRQFPDQ
jgi:hypothetical protein